MLRYGTVGCGQWAQRGWTWASQRFFSNQNDSMNLKGCLASMCSTQASREPAARPYPHCILHCGTPELHALRSQARPEGTQQSSSPTVLQLQVQPL